MNAKGFTLLELMIATVIAVIVTAAAFNFFTNTYNFSVVHKGNIEMQQETRSAIDLMSREIRNAGFGVKDPLTTNGVLPGAAASPIISPTNGALDQIAIWGGFQQIGTLICNAPPCANPVAAEGAVQVRVKPTPGTDPTSPTVVGNMVTLGGFYTGRVVAVAGPSGAAPDIYYTLTLDTPLNRQYSQNTSVVRLQQIIYSIAVPVGENEPVLFRSDDGVLPGQRLASGVEDLQFAYLLTDGTVVNDPGVMAPGVIPPIRAVRIGMVARARDPNRQVNSVSTRPALEDHAAGSAADGYHRRVIQKIAEVRNLGF